MTWLNALMFQVAQPYFLYSIVFLSVAFTAIRIFLKYNPYISRQRQSIIWLIPLLIPIIVLSLFHPQILVNATYMPENFSIYIFPICVAAAASPSVLSLTGVLCISGVVAAAAFFAFMLTFGVKVAYKRFHIIMMAPSEYPEIQAAIKKTANKLGIKEPKAALVDDLVPNAFTVGYGSNTTVVLSLGILNMLSIDELTAVISHELAHIKAKDYLFKVTASAFNILSFFNPLSYVVASYSQKERELLADGKAAALLDNPSLMAKVLTKVQAVVEEFPKQGLAQRISSSLFLVSPLAHTPGILASHPQITQRIQNINAHAAKHSRKRRYLLTATLLLGVLVCAAFVVGYSTVQAQNAYNQKENSELANTQGFYVYYNESHYNPQNDSSYVFDPAHPTGFYFNNATSLQEYLTIMSRSGQYEDCYIDAKGQTHIYYSDKPILLVDKQDIYVYGQRAGNGNESYSFPPAPPATPSR